MKNIPQRTCIGCNCKKDKDNLIRIVKNKNGEVSPDIYGKMEGRGIYLCKSNQCLDKAIKNKKMNRAFEMDIKADLYEQIREHINGGEFIG